MTHAHNDMVISAAWSPDGTRVATAGFDNTVRIWSVKRDKLEPLYLPGKPWGSITTLSVSPRRKTGFAGTFDRMTPLYQLDLEACQMSLVNVTPGEEEQRSVPEPVRAVVCVPDSPHTFLGWGASLRRRDEAGATKPWGPPETAIESIAAAPDGHVVAFGCTDGLLHFWSVGEPLELRRVQVDAAPILGLAYVGPDRVLAITRTRDPMHPVDQGHVSVVDKDEEPKPIPIDSVPVCVTASPSGHLAATGHLNGDVRIWRFPTKGGVSSVAVNFKDTQPTCLLFLDEHRLVVGTMNQPLTLVSTDTQKKTKTWRLPDGDIPFALDRLDDRSFVVGSGLGRVLRIELK
jgi:WD40 repeat protein